MVSSTELAKFRYLNAYYSTEISSIN